MGILSAPVNTLRPCRVRQMFGHDQPTGLQRDILELYDRYPNMSPKQIADDLDCSASYVRETINEYRSSGGLL